MTVAMQLWCLLLTKFPCHPSPGAAAAGPLASGLRPREAAEGVPDEDQLTELKVAKGTFLSDLCTFLRAQMCLHTSDKAKLESQCQPLLTIP